MNMRVEGGRWGRRSGISEQVSGGRAGRRGEGGRSVVREGEGKKKGYKVDEETGKRKEGE